jgi:hypothetical protein
MAKPPPKVTADDIKKQYFNQTSRMADEVASFASKRFLELGNWSDATVQQYLASVLPVVTAGQKQMSALTKAYYSLLGQLLGENLNTVNIPADQMTTTALRGVAGSTVYTRGHIAMRTALSQGKSLDYAVQLGAQRIYNIARTDMQLAKTNTGLAIRNGNSGIVGYVRVLSGAENCAKCYVASTQRYHRGNLMPIHPGCDCGEEPIFGSQDPGQVIDRANLEATHEAVALRFGKSARDTRTIDYSKIAVRRHGELGPVLTVADQHFTGPNAIK